LTCRSRRTDKRAIENDDNMADSKSLESLKKCL
jgi:hypothetical protein